MPPRFALIRLAGAVLALLTLAPLRAQDALDLAGPWQVELDRANTGLTQHWFERDLTGRAQLPGSVQSNHLGDPVTVDTPWTGGIFDKSWFTSPDYAAYRQPGNIKVPFWLQPETHYTGIAWYQREITVPAAWAGQRLVLTLERPHWKTTVWLDGTKIGQRDSLSTAHEYDLGTAVAAGPHRLTIRVDNTLDPDVGENSHSVSDHTQGNWNGLAGALTLTPTAPAWIEDLQVTTRLSDRVALVRGNVATTTGTDRPGTVRLQIDDTPPAREVTIAADGTFSAELPLGAGAALWDEFSPVLHTLTATLVSSSDTVGGAFLSAVGLPASGGAEGDQGHAKAERPDGLKPAADMSGHKAPPTVQKSLGIDTRTVRFGLRSIAADGRQLLINGRKLFLRGTLDCAAFPRTGHPPTDVAAWKKEFAAIQAHGLNHVRFHSWCPPDAAFTAADELGVYLQVEVATWPNWSTSLGDGKAIDGWLEAETRRILHAYGHHPSFILFAAGNEPGGAHHPAWLADWVQRWKSVDAGRLYTAGAGWPEVPPNDYQVRSEPRIQHWEEGLHSRINRLPPETVTDYRDYIGARATPVISHEIGQWCVYPNFAEMPKYTGYLKPRNFEIFSASLAAHQMAAQAHDFLIASGKLQALCYKEDIESALRTPAMGGFQLLGLNDFPGQGTALVGVLDAFWEEKGYVTPAEFRRFAGSTVPLARLAQRVFTTAESLTADVEVAHFGATPLAHTAATWTLTGDDGRKVASGNFAARDIPVGAGNTLGRIDLPLRDIPAPARYRLAVALDGTAFANDWDVWVYPGDPAIAPAPAGVLVTTSLDTAALAQLEAGGRVWLMFNARRIKPDAQRGPIALGFSSIFWNTAWTHGQAPHTLGILCDPTHPALASFPTDGWTNWQWWYPLQHAAPMILDELPAALRPTVQVIDDWVTNRKLGLVFEAKIGSGRLLVTSIELDNGEQDPVRRQLRTSLLAYLASRAFAPTVEVTPAQIRSITKP